MRQKLRLLLHALAINGTNVSQSLRQIGLRNSRHSGAPRFAPRLLFYAVNGVGLGHVTRLLGIARQVRNLRPDAEILFLTSSEATHLIYREGFASLKTPSHTLAQEKMLSSSAVQRLNHHAAQTAILAFDPHCLVVDCFPSGIQDELWPTLQTKLRKVFVFRTQRENATREAQFQSALRLYDLILVPHISGSETLPLPQNGRAVWTGPMVSYERSEMLTKEAARSALGLPQNGFIGLITFGGGGEKEIPAARMQIQKALQKINDNSLWVEAVGPLSRENATAPWRLLREAQPLMLYLNAFDGAISASGYNTVQELQSAHLPAILWPFARLLDDQTARAQQLKCANRAWCLGEGAHENRVDELADALRELMNIEARETLRAALQAAPETRLSNGALLGAQEILKLL